MPYVNGEHLPYNPKGRKAAEKARKKGKKVRYMESTYDRMIGLIIESRKKKLGISDKARDFVVRGRVARFAKASRKADREYDRAEKDYEESGSKSQAESGVRNPSIHTRDAMKIHQDISQQAAKSYHKEKTRPLAKQALKPRMRRSKGTRKKVANLVSEYTREQRKTAKEVEKRELERDLPTPKDANRAAGAEATAQHYLMNLKSASRKKAASKKSK